MREFFDWYNFEHYHTGIALLTPDSLHTGLADQIFDRRQIALNSAYAEHPGRFVNGPPLVQRLPASVWINGPAVFPLALSA